MSKLTPISLTKIKNPAYRAYMGVRRALRVNPELNYLPNDIAIKLASDLLKKGKIDNAVLALSNLWAILDLTKYVKAGLFKPVDPEYIREKTIPSFVRSLVRVCE